MSERSMEQARALREKVNEAWGGPPVTQSDREGWERDHDTAVAAALDEARAEGAASVFPAHGPVLQYGNREQASQVADLMGMVAAANALLDECEERLGATRDQGHDWSCHHTHRDGRPCDCGLDALLARLRQRKEGA